MTSAITVKQLQKTYKSGWFGGRRVEALKSVSFTVEPGSIFGLLGPNGAGKTTLIKVLLGIVRKSGGQATLLGRAAGDRIGRRTVGYLPENHRIPRHLTATSALIYYGGLSGLSAADVRRRAPELLHRVGLADWMTTSVKKFSKGMQQRLGLAQAMLHDPQLLILDEPTDGVDPVGRSEMRQALQDLKQEGKTIFINSHLLQEVELVCDRVAVLTDGVLRKEGTVDELTAQKHSDVRLTLRAMKNQVEEALRDIEHVFGLPDPLVADRVYVTITAPTQDDVNRCIDRLRQNDIGIAELYRPRLTLEDAFLNIVDEHKNSSAANGDDEAGVEPNRQPGSQGTP